MSATTRGIKKLACFKKAALFFHGKDIFFPIPLISDIIYEVSDQMNSETPQCAIFNVTLYIRLLDFQWIERLTVILHADIQDPLFGGNRDFNKMIRMVVETVG